jgi:hypothetical protein
MRSHLLLLTLTAAVLLYSVACGSSDQSKSDTTNGAQALPTPTIKQSSQSAAPTAPSSTTDNTAPVSVAHGAPQAGNASTGAPTGGPDTATLDKKIEQAEAKAKAPNAKPADKQAAAAAYVERANVFYNAGQPMLYKFALRDFRLALRYDENNAEAREKRDQIVAIYQQMGRPVPELGNEP